MFSKIMCPVDLAHADKLQKALQCAADQARLYKAEIVYVGATTPSPSSVAHNPEEYAEKLSAFAAKQAEAHGVTTSAHTVISHDPAIDLEHKLFEAVSETGADLVVMASHVPNVLDHIWPSNGGKLAEHVKCSILVVRG
ncbi:universal stress protein [Marinibacterium profundimaris]|uniref:Universal stress protein UspA n=1 Tax=Marinibacterium profundimaris TaxID=1679460 RepID=A0A225NFP7_9RHOB|nr:universal stress protein [Marinibacterium profundimaris]OWU67806.1 universal stress protein UspA [Marinibacterium profundimaris]